tara:strand:+ start:327 stop:905 length:579 start_codon:yes stop_codon:yes gene_type:complete
MKKFFIIILILILTSTKSFSESISDLEIEGFSIGQSLLKTFSKKKIINFFNYDDLPSSMKFRIAEIYNEKEINMDLYDAMQFYYKPEDSKFIIHGMNGFLFCKTSDFCETTFNQIFKDIKSSFSKNEFNEWNDVHPDDPSGESLVKGATFSISGGSLVIRYTDWSDKVEYTDNVGIEISTDEVSNWIRNNYY